MDRRKRRNAGLLLGGAIVGIGLSLVAVLIFMSSVTEFRTMEELLRRVDLPEEVLSPADVEYGGPFAVTLREVALLDASGDTVAAIPVATFQLEAEFIVEGEPIVLDAVRLREPFLNMVQGPDGEFNLAGVVAMEAGGQPVEMGGESGGFILRDVRTINGRVRLITPWVPTDTATAGDAPPAGVRLASRGGRTVRIRRVQNLDATLPLVRVGGGEGWRAVVASASARLTDPEIRLAQFSGEFEGEGTSVEFEIEQLSTAESEISGEGSLDFGGATLAYDVTLRANPVSFADLKWVVPNLPTEGTASGTVALQSRDDGRIALAATDLVVSSLGSRIEGTVSAIVGGGLPAVFQRTELRLDPLRLETIKALGLAMEIPYTGELTGTVSSAGDSPGLDRLHLDIVAQITPEGSDLLPSSIALQGPISVGAADEMVHLHGVRLTLRPLHLEALRPLIEGQDARLRGDLTGSVLASGTLQSIQITEGTLAYEVGDAPTTTFTDVALDLTRNGEITFDFSASADPLNLLTLKEIFPAIPFRQARLSGPIRVFGTAENMQLRADLQGSEGGIALEGTISPGETLAFDLSGRVSAFRPGEFLTRDVPVEGPVTGTFAAAGNMSDFRFDVDLAQASGRFALEGRFIQSGGEPIIEVAGNVSDFDLGALIGRPGLFPDPLAGDIDISGGGSAPYQFDVDLAGTIGGLDLSGTFMPGSIPVYDFAGSVRGLDLQQIPGAAALPQTNLNATLDVNGRGTTVETLEGQLTFTATGSMIGGVPVQTLVADVAVQDGILLVDTLIARIADAQLAAGGAWGLTRPATDSLSFSLQSDDLSRLAPIVASVQGLEPQLSGSIELAGWVAGTFEDPLLRAVGQGQGLRYEGWQAGSFALDMLGSFGAGIEEIQGRLAFVGQDIVIAGTTELQSIDLEVNGRSERMTLLLDVKPDAQTTVSLGGILEMDGRSPRALALDSLTVEVDDLVWRLANQTTLAWGGDEGIVVDNLRLERVGDATGWVLVNGVLPPTGVADLEISAAQVDLALLSRLLPSVPEIAGNLSMEATLQGPVSDPELILDARVTDLLYREVASDEVVLEAFYNDGQLESTASIRVQGAEVATAVATLPMRLTISDIVPSFELIETAPMSVTVQADSLPVALITAGITTVQDGQGIVGGEITVGGTPNDPVVGGWATIARGALTIDPLGIRYEGITGRLSLEDNLVSVDSLRIRSEGSALIDGTIRLTDLRNPEIYLTLTLEGFRAIENEEVAELTITGDLALSGALPDPVLTGRLQLDEGVIAIPELNERAPLEITNVEVGQIGADTVSMAAAAPGLLGTIRVDQLEVSVRDGVWLESADARVEIRGELIVIRQGMAPQVFGSLEAVRGSYTLEIGVLVREFDIVSGAVRFFGTDDLNPELDITAAHEIRAPSANAAANNLTILVHLTGTLEYPRIELTSNTRPPLPESELLNWLVFGQPTFRLAGTEQLAEQILFQEILGGLLAEQLGQIFPCDYFRLRGRPEFELGALSQGLSATALECGVQLVPDVFLTVEAAVAGIFGNSLSFGASLDWEINDVFTARMAVEPVQDNPLRYLASPNVDYQFSTDLDATWEFGFPEEPALDQELPGALPGTVAPSEPEPVPETPKKEETPR